MAAVLSVDGGVDQPGYKLLRDKARVDQHQATATLDQFRVFEQSDLLPPFRLSSSPRGNRLSMRGGSARPAPGGTSVRHSLAGSSISEEANKAAVRPL